MPTFNGAFYIDAQLQSILASPLVSEVIVSDDGSTDDTVEIVKSFRDPRIILRKGPGKGLIKNYEFLLSQTSFEYIFLADQDDVWLPKKVELMLDYLRDADLAVCDCTVVDEQLNLIHPSFFLLRNSGPGLTRNLMHNRYLGCCIAFRRRLLKYALPFPPGLPMHDWWLGLIAEIFGRVVFIDQPLMLYRRHGLNASQTAERSNAPWMIRIRWRITLIGALVRRKFKFT